MNAWQAQTARADLSGASVKICEQNLARLRASLATTANKDQVRRAIRATEDRLKALKSL